MEAAELRGQSRAELLQRLTERRQKADELSWSLRRRKSKNVKALAAVRKDIARILTVLRQLR